MVPVAQRVRHRGFKILGFEPQRPLYQALDGALALNDLEQCFLYEVGLSTHRGQAHLPSDNYAKNFDFGTVSIQDASVNKPINYLDLSTVPTISIDSLQLPRLDFIKLDIEGHVCQALEGGLNSIRQHRPLIWVEYFLTGRQEIVDCLAGVSDYVFHTLDRQNMLCAPVEKLATMGVRVESS